MLTPCRAAVLLPLAVLLLSACGGSEEPKEARASSAPSTTTGPTAEELTRSICDDIEVATQLAVKVSNGDGTAADSKTLDRTVTRALADQRTLETELAGGPDARKLRTWLVAVRDDVVKPLTPEDEFAVLETKSLAARDVCTATTKP